MNSITKTRGATGETLVLALAAAMAAACGSGSAPSAPAFGSRLSTYHTTDASGAVALKDRTGAAIPVGSTTPYSPEKTCGGCHDFATVTQGYHFQQGRGFSNADIRVSDTYNPTKPWLLSDGMYGKW